MIYLVAGDYNHLIKGRIVMTNQEIVDVGNYQHFLKEWEDGYENVLSHLHGTDVTQTVQYGLKREYYYFRVEEIAYE